MLKITLVALIILGVLLETNVFLKRFEEEVEKLSKKNKIVLYLLNITFVIFLIIIAIGVFPLSKLTVGYAILFLIMLITGIAVYLYGISKIACKIFDKFS